MTPMLDIDDTGRHGNSSAATELDLEVNELPLSREGELVDGMWS